MARPASFPTGPGLQSLAVLESNIRAIEACVEFARGLSPFVVLYGPSGWGKSHLVASLEAEMEAQGSGPVRLRDAVAWVSAPLRSDHRCALMLDDVQGVVRHPRLRHALRTHLEHRTRTGRSTLLCITSRRPVATAKLLPVTIPAWKFAAIHEPSIRERLVIVRQLASQRRLSIADEVGYLIANHLHGNGRSILGAIERLKLAGSGWDRPESVLPACGVLSPYLIGNDGWDARDVVADAVAQAAPSLPPGVSANDLVAYFLLCELGLSEGESAAFTKLGECGVYRRAIAVRRQLDDPQVRSVVEACRTTIVSAFGAR
jgi:energy-coupling factor transporter ATP-binding protein EcfA2